VAGHAQFKFSAFLSYAHADARWGTWLHKRLEGYKLDRELVGRVTPPGQCRRRCDRSRDRDDFSGGQTLTDATKAIHQLPAPRAGGSLESPPLLAPMAKPTLSMMRRSRFKPLLRQSDGFQPKSRAW
jgi:hypothetical protein